MITVFVIGLMSITIGSALLNTLLTITGTTKVKENRWLIHFDNVQIDDDSVKNSDPHVSAVGSETGYDYSILEYMK